MKNLKALGSTHQSIQIGTEKVQKSPGGPISQNSVTNVRRRHVTNEAFKKNIVKTQNTEQSPGTTTIFPIGMHKCSWSPNGSKHKVSTKKLSQEQVRPQISHAVLPMRGESPKVIRKANGNAMLIGMGAPSHTGFSKKKNPSIFLTTDGGTGPGGKEPSCSGNNNSRRFAANTGTSRSKKKSMFKVDDSMPIYVSTKKDRKK
jgi:hypothetical protein